MKRSLIILSSLILLSGCAAQQPEITVPELPPAPTAFVAPGEVVEFGDAAHIGVGDVREPLAEFTVMGVDVIEGDESFWQKLQNADDFAGQTPYFVIMQLRQDAGDDIGPTPQFFPMLEDGSSAVVEGGFGSAMAGSLPCGLDLPSGGEGVTVKCYVGVGSPETPVVGAQWFNSHSAEAYVDDSATSNPYFASPVEFRANS